jgi:hypothetical protein
MQGTEKVESWVVYLMTLPGNQPPMNAVCRQYEWEALELARPGFNTLIRSGIATESEAEKLARGNSGDPRKRGSVKSEPVIDSSSDEETTTPD